MSHGTSTAPFSHVRWYGLAVLLVVCGVVLRHVLSDFFGDKAYYITFYPAVMVAAIFGGAGPAIVVTVLSAIASDYWVLPPTGQLLNKNTGDVGSLVVFVCMGFFISALAAAYHRSREAAQKALEDTIEAERDFSSAVLATAGALVVVLDRQGRIVRLNRTFERLTGYSFEEAKHRDFSKLFLVPDEVPAVKAVFAQLCEGQSAKEHENHLVAKDRAPRLIRWSDTTLCAKDGSVEYVIGTGVDVTEERHAAEALRKAHDELEQRVAERTRELKATYDQLKEEVEERQKAEARLRQAQKMEALGTLTGGIAHDFNNILAAIIGFAELIRDHVPKGSREERHAARVVQAGLRGRGLIKQMLTFSRRTDDEQKPLLLGSVVKETVKFLRQSIPSTVTMRTDVKNENGVIFGDPVQIQQVIMNLVTNAAYAMREKGGVLDVEVGNARIPPGEKNPHDIEPGAYMRLVVRDTGTGMGPEHVERVFEPFFTTKQVGEGTGLGLSVVLGIVKQCHGHITAESELGKGSTFTVYFPKIEDEKATEEGEREESIPTGSERILFVDDEETVVEMGEEVLAELGYEVVCRTKSTEALALFRSDPSRFDLIITDQTMPEMTGVELAGKIFSIRPDVPVILATGFSALVDADSAKAAGIRAFVMKPLTKREVAGTVRQVLDE